MPIRIKARTGESAQQLMRRFKKMCEKEGLIKDIKRRAFYENPRQRRQRALRKSIKRVQMRELAASSRNGNRNAARGNNQSSGR